MIAAGFEISCAVDHDPLAAMTCLVNIGRHPMRIHFASNGDEGRFNKALETESKGSNEPEMLRCGAARPPGRTPVRSFIFGDVRRVTGGGHRARGRARRAPGTWCSAVRPARASRGGTASARPTNPRNRLISEMARIVTELRPKTFMLENVPGIADRVTAEGVPVLTAFANAVGRGGYEAYEALRGFREHRACGRAGHDRRPEGPGRGGARRPGGGGDAAARALRAGLRARGGRPRPREGTRKR